MRSFTSKAPTPSLPPSSLRLLTAGATRLRVGVAPTEDLHLHGAPPPRSGFCPMRPTARDPPPSSNSAPPRGRSRSDRDEQSYLQTPERHFRDRRDEHLLLGATAHRDREGSSRREDVPGHLRDRPGRTPRTGARGCNGRQRSGGQSLDGIRPLGRTPDVEVAATRWRHGGRGAETKPIPAVGRCGARSRSGETTSPLKTGTKSPVVADSPSGV